MGVPCLIFHVDVPYEGHSMFIVPCYRQWDALGKFPESSILGGCPIPSIIPIDRHTRKSKHERLKVHERSGNEAIYQSHQTTDRSEGDETPGIDRESLGKLRHYLSSVSIGVTDSE